MDVLEPVPIRSRLGRRSAHKGGKFERDVSRAIGEWWCGDPNSFWRTRGSGSMSGRTGIHHGDIAPVKLAPHQAPLTIECKHVKAWSLAEFLVGGKRCAAFRFWAQLQREKRPGTLGLLILRGDRTPIYVMVSSADIAAIHCITRLPPVPHMVLPAVEAQFWTFRDFAAVVSPAAVKQASFGRNHPDWGD